MRCVSHFSSRYNLFRFMEEFVNEIPRTSNTRQMFVKSDDIIIPCQSERKAVTTNDLTCSICKMMEFDHLRCLEN